MARNPWKKYIIGIAGVTVIGSAVGLAQQLDSTNNVTTTVLPSPATDTSIEQQFAAAEVVTDTEQPTATVAPTATSTTAPRKVTRQLAPTQPNDEYVWNDEDEDEDEDEYEDRHHHHDDDDDDDDYEDEDDDDDDDDDYRSSGKMRSQAS